MEDNFEQKMEKLSTPNTDFIKHQNVLKIGMVNARKSARIGIVFVLIPVVLIVLAYVKIKLLIHWHFFENMEHFVSSQNRPGVLNWVHLYIIAFPIVAIMINLLAITHFYVDKKTKEFIITIQYRLKNIMVALVSIVLIVSVLLYISFFIS
jgi:hypothetical protein